MRCEEVSRGSDVRSGPSSWTCEEPGSVTQSQTSGPGPILWVRLGLEAYWSRQFWILLGQFVFVLKKEADLFFYKGNKQNIDWKLESL